MRSERLTCLSDWAILEIADDGQHPCEGGLPREMWFLRGTTITGVRGRATITGGRGGACPRLRFCPSSPAARLPSSFISSSTRHRSRGAASRLCLISRSFSPPASRFHPSFFLWNDRPADLRGGERRRGCYVQPAGACFRRCACSLATWCEALAAAP